PGQQDSGIADSIWAAAKARDSLSSTWGPTGTSGGVTRYPTGSRWGWNQTASARITVPVLVMNGLNDNVVSVAASPLLYNNLTGTTRKTIVQVGCASHLIFDEGCSGSTCNGWTGPHATVAKNIKDWVLTGMIYASPGSTNGSFVTTDNDGTSQHLDPI